MHHNCSDPELKLSQYICSDPELKLNQYIMKVSVLLNCVISLDAAALISGSSGLESPH